MKSLYFAACCTSLALATQSMADGWVPTGSTSELHAGSGLVTLQDGRALTTARQLRNEIYNPTTQRWTAAGNRTFSGFLSDAVVMLDGRVLSTGAERFQWSAEIWDPAVESWRLTSPMSVSRLFVGLALLPNGNVLAAGGTTLGSLSRTAEIFNPAKESWSMTGEMVLPHGTQGALIPLPDGRVFLAVRDTEIFDPTTETWRLAARMPTARIGYSVTLLSDGRVMVAGGDGTLRSVEIFDPTTETWTAAASLLTRRTEHRAALLPDSRVLVAGGRLDFGEDSPILNSTEVYDAVTDTWSPGPNMTLQRTQFLMTSVPTGVLAAGGYYYYYCDFVGDCSLLTTNSAEILPF